MPGTQVAVLEGMPVFKFKEVSAVAVSPAVKAFAAIHTRYAARSQAQRAFNDWKFESATSPP